MAKKDDFRNAAAMFIDTASDLREVPDAEKKSVPADSGLDTETIIKNYLTENGLKLVRSETRTKKLHISVTPTLADAIKAKAKAEKKSQNEIINDILEQAFLFGKK